MLYIPSMVILRDHNIKKYKPHGVGTQKHFFGSKSKKTSRFMIFDPSKEGCRFSTFLPPPPPHPTSLKSSKKWVSSWGGLGRSGPKTHWGVCLLDKMMILQGVKLTIQPLEVGYADRPKKAQKGGIWRFPLYTGLPGFNVTIYAR